MIIKIIGLSFLALFMFGIGYICGVIMKGLETELDSREAGHRLQTVKEMMCDHYCRHVDEAGSQEALDSICESCPLNKI